MSVCECAFIFVCACALIPSKYDAAILLCFFCFVFFCIAYRIALGKNHACMCMQLCVQIWPKLELEFTESIFQRRDYSASGRQFSFRDASLIASCVVVVVVVAAVAGGIVG